MLNETQPETKLVRTNHALRAQWPDLSKDQRAMELAKVAMGWADMDTAQQMANLSALARRAQEFKEAL